METLNVSLINKVVDKLNILINTVFIYFCAKALWYARCSDKAEVSGSIPEVPT